MWYNNIFSVWTDTKKPSVKKLNRMRNDIVFQNEFIRNYLDAMHRYRLVGCPDTCSERVILESLLLNGCVFVFEKQGGVIALPGAPDGSGINLYRDYAGAYVYGANGYNEHIKLAIPGGADSNILRETMSGHATSTARGVMIRENEMCYPFIMQTIYWSERQSDTLRKIETAARNAASPYIVTAEESIVPTVKSFFDHRDNNEEYIVSSGIFPADRINLLPFDVSADAIKTMTETYDWYCNHYRELCSTKNTTNIDKKGENLLNAEININDEYTNKQGGSIIDYMNAQLELANELFGTNMRFEEVDHGHNDVSGVQDGAHGSVPRDDT